MVCADLARPIITDDAPKPEPADVVIVGEDGRGDEGSKMRFPTSTLLRAALRGTSGDDEWKNKFDMTSPFLPFVVEAMLREKSSDWGGEDASSNEESTNDPTLGERIDMSISIADPSLMGMPITGLEGTNAGLA